MSSEYAIALFGFFIGLCAVVALVWALMHRQLQTKDQEMYEAVADDEPDYTAASSLNLKQIPRRLRWLFAIVFTAVFALIGWIIILTVRASTRVPSSPPIVRQQPASE